VATCFAVWITSRCGTRQIPGAIFSVGLAGAFKRLRGWQAQGAAIAEAARGYDAVMADDREILGGLVYYARAADVEFVAWNSNRTIDDHYEAFHAFDPDRHGRVLFVTQYADAHELGGRVAAQPVGETRADLGGGRTRTLYLFEVTPTPAEAQREAR